MSFLESLTPDQKEMIVSLPYRVGLWVADSDITGGAEAHEQERQVLSNIIHGFAEEMFGSEAMQHIISGTLAKKNQWGEWASEVASVPNDCRMAVDIIREYGDNKDVNVFRNHLMEIGEAVAMAFREDTGRGLQIGAYLSYLAEKMGKKHARWRNRSFQDFLRISMNERKALITLSRALGAAH